MFDCILDILQTFELHLEARIEIVRDPEHMELDVHHFAINDEEFFLHKGGK